MTLLVLLDLSDAFDTVDPSILLTRLRSKLGLNGTALSWFCSYLSGRTQRISVQGALSNVFHLRYGVPQGSCLGPLLFNIYSNKIFDIVGRHLPKVHCYADDCQLYLSFNPSCAFRWGNDEAVGHLHDGVILLLRPESFSFLLSYLNSSPIDELGNWCLKGWTGA